MYLMSKDVKVAAFDMDGRVTVYREELMPPQRNLPAWLQDRVLPLSRSNAKWIYSLLNLSQSQSSVSREYVALFCRAVSVLDCYWIKFGDYDMASWSNVNIRKNSLNTVITDASILGQQISLRGNLATPELTLHGVAPKAWIREDGKLKLCKAGDGSKLEVMCSALLDACNVAHVRYESGRYKGVEVCKCECLTDDDVGIFTAEDLMNSLSLADIAALDIESFYKMWIVDYLLANGDRHFGNWGFLFYTDTNEIIACHPLLDHDNAFGRTCMEFEDFPYPPANNISMRDAARYAVSAVDFHFTSEITRDMFLTEGQWDCFMSRAAGLKLL